MQYVLKSSAARVQTVPSTRAQRQAHGRAARSSPAGLDQTKPQMLYPADPQPYGSGFPLNVKDFRRDRDVPDLTRVDIHLYPFSPAFRARASDIHLHPFAPSFEDHNSGAV